MEWWYQKNAAGGLVKQMAGVKGVTNSISISPKVTKKAVETDIKSAFKRSQNEFARLINNLSAPFVAPFSTLFVSPTFGGGTYIFDVNILIAIVTYALLSYLSASLVKFIFYHES